MEELLVFAILLYQEMVTKEEYDKRLNELFLNDPENDDLVHLEWETDIKKSIIYIWTHADYSAFDYEQFGHILISKLKVIYEKCIDIRDFAYRMYNLWESLPGNIQDREPFNTLCYAGDPLSYGDEELSRNIYENMLNYYEE